MRWTTSRPYVMLEHIIAYPIKFDYILMIVKWYYVQDAFGFGIIPFHLNKAQFYVWLKSLIFFEKFQFKIKQNGQVLSVVSLL